MTTYTNTQIQDALMGQVQSIAAGKTVVWQNDQNSADAPRWDVDLFFNGNPETGIDGKAVQLGILQVTAVVQAGTFTGATMPDAETIKAAFPAGSTIGGAVIYSVPAIEGGFVDGAEYRQPVSIYFRFLTT